MELKADVYMSFPKEEVKKSYNMKQLTNFTVISLFEWCSKKLRQQRGIKDDVRN